MKLIVSTVGHIINHHKVTTDPTTCCYPSVYGMSRQMPGHRVVVCPSLYSQSNMFSCFSAISGVLQVGANIRWMHKQIAVMSHF